MKALTVGITIAMISAVLALLISLFPTFAPDSQVLQLLDSGLALLINFFNMARWFFPFNVFIVCFTAMFAVDHFALIARIIQYLVSLVRG